MPQLDSDRLRQAFIAVWAVGNGSMVEGLSFLLKRRPTEGELEPLTAALSEMGRSVSGPMYLMAITYFQQVARQVARFMVDHDVMLTPVAALPPLPLGSFEPKPGDPLAGLWRAAEFTPFTPLCNVTGQPAMSVPLSWNREGLPLGAHVVGRFGDEATLFRLAAQLEAARPWAQRYATLMR
jgi:amidase